MWLRTALAIVLLVLLGYGATEAWPLLAGPRLSLTAPADGATIPDGMLTVTGTVARVTALSLDGAPVLPQQNGTFSQVLVLPHGSTILTLSAADRFGRTRTVTRSVFVP